ncbi:intracellular protein transport protein USO1-like [Solanum lycopersicum]|uniref:intracellular protein transport protein USO1-like n=1 Tax=Solanum lycopersicum TaxID=4081 RepID=UPI00374A4B38
MAAPPTPQEGASQTQPLVFNGKYYGWWKNRMMDHLIGKNPDLWGVILDGPTIPMKTATDGITKISKERKEWNAEEKLAIQNNAKAKKILICGIGPDEYNRISSCQDARRGDYSRHAHQELKKNQEKEIGGKRKERNLVLKATTSDDFEEENIALINKRFTRMLKRGQTFQKKASEKPSENTKDQALEQKKENFEKGKDIKKDKFVPSNRRMTTQETDMSMKRAFAAMGNSSDEESEGDETKNQSLLALEQEDDYDFLALVAVETKEEKETCRSQETILALMAGSDSKDDEEDDNQIKVLKIDKGWFSVNQLEIHLIWENMMMQHSCQGLEYEELEKNQSKHGVIETIPLGEGRILTCADMFTQTILADCGIPMESEQLLKELKVAEEKYATLESENQKLRAELDTSNTEIHRLKDQLVQQLRAKLDTSNAEIHRLKDQ